MNLYCIIITYGLRWSRALEHHGEQIYDSKYLEWALCVCVCWFSNTHK